METLPMQLFCGPRPTAGGFHPITGSSFNGKPRGGMWTSTWETAFEEGWPGWCIRESSYQPSDGWLLRPNPCRVLTISDPAGAIEMLERFGSRLDGVGDYWQIDWLQVMGDYDAVRLTAPYHPEIRFSRHQKVGMNFYGWDCESTVWLGWYFSGEPQHVDLRERSAALAANYPNDY